MNVKALSALFPLTIRGRRITLTLLLLSILTSAISIQPVNASLSRLIVYETEIDGLRVSIKVLVLYIYTGIHWNWGDGNEEDRGPQASHIYSSYGDYTITVTAYLEDPYDIYDWAETKTIHISLRLMVETTDEAGERKDVFDIPETVYISGSGYLPSTIYDLYVVEDTTWSGGMGFPDRVSGTETSVETDVNGDIPAGTVAWKGPLTPGKYDIVIDRNNNDKYDEGIDALDDEDIEVTAGFFVIPEIPLGTLMGIVTCFVALATFRLKRLNFKH
jgi:hypothetical protein